MGISKDTRRARNVIDATCSRIYIVASIYVVCTLERVDQSYIHGHSFSRRLLVTVGESPSGLNRSAFLALSQLKVDYGSAGVFIWFHLMVIEA